jgi:hypothetical protein
MNEKIEWEQQLNIYAWLVEKAKKTVVTDVGIVAIIRDWNRRDSTNREGYPEAPVKELPVRLWTYEERENFIQDRIAKHSACEFAVESETPLPECTPEEMWEKQTTWAIKKEGGVRAKSVHSTKEEADVALTKGYVIEVRPGERTRCANYCQVKNNCIQWKNYQEEVK